MKWSCFLFFLPTLVFAHAHLKLATPAKDSTVQIMPKEVRIEFSEGLEIAMSNIEVKNVVTNEIVSEKLEEKNESGNENKFELKVNLKNIKNAKATYQVSWKAVSKDGHTTKGTYDFTFVPASKQ